MLKNLGILFLNPSISTVVHLTETNKVELYLFCLQMGHLLFSFV